MFRYTLFTFSVSLGVFDCFLVVGETVDFFAVFLHVLKNNVGHMLKMSPENLIQEAQLLVD